VAFGVSLRGLSIYLDATDPTAHISRLLPAAASNIAAHFSNDMTVTETLQTIRSKIEPK